MISDELCNLADAMLLEAKAGEPMQPARYAAFAAIALNLSIQVRVLEDKPVPQRARWPRQAMIDVGLPQPEGWTR